MKRELEPTFPVEGQHVILDTRDAWLERRRPIIGGTDAAKVIGVSKWGTAMDVFLEKTGKLQPDVEAEKAQWRASGLRLERPILEWYADRDQIPMLFTPHSITFSPTQKDIIGVSLDAVRQDGDPYYRPVDAKNIRWRDGEWGEDMTDEFPVYYAAQLVMQMHVTGADFADLAVLFSGQDLTIYRLFRDKSLEADIVQRVVDFYQRHIVADVPPAVDGSTGYAAWLAKKFATHTEQLLPPTPELHKAALEFVTVKEDLKRLANQESLLKNLFKAAIGDARGILGTGWKAQWSKVKDSVSCDWEAAFNRFAADIALRVEAGTLSKAALADLIGEAKNAATKTKPGYRRFTLTTQKAGSEE